MAEKLTGWSAAKAVNRYVTEVIPQCRLPPSAQIRLAGTGAIFEIGNVKVVGNRVPIIVDGIIDGVITTIQKLEVLQKIESKIRFKLL
jgi:propionate catabolism operon transcriptional regulator